MRPGTTAGTLLACSILAACGSSSPKKAATIRTAPDPAATVVVRAWSEALRHGAVEEAAKLFAVPSRVQIVPGAALQTLDSRTDAEFFNFSLPCGGRLLKATRRGRYVDALFLLSDRPGSHCDAPGETARAAFLVRAGKIAEWRRVAGEPGDERYERKSPRTGPLV
jgi:hypothetical protein